MIQNLFQPIAIKWEWICTIATVSSRIPMVMQWWYVSSRANLNQKDFDIVLPFHRSGRTLPRIFRKGKGEKLRNSKIYRAMELAKYETWEGSGKNTRPLFSEEGGFQNAIKCLFKSKWDFLNKELAKYATWEEFRSGKNTRPIITSEPEFRSIKGKWDFLNKELAKYATWEEIRSGKNTLTNFADVQSEPAFRKVKDETYGISIFIEREKTTSRNV